MSVFGRWRVCSLAPNQASQQSRPLSSSADTPAMTSLCSVGCRC